MERYVWNQNPTTLEGYTSHIPVIRPSNAILVYYGRRLRTILLVQTKLVTVQHPVARNHSQEVHKKGMNVVVIACALSLAPSTLCYPSLHM